MRNRSKLLIMAISLILCLSVSIGLVFAYFTDYENGRGGAILKLSGQTEIEEKVDEDGKHIVIKNVDETDMVVRVQVIGNDSRMGVIEGENWVDGGDGWYYYSKILKGSKDGDGEETSVLDAYIKVEDSLLDDFEVIVVQEAERVIYDGDTVVVPKGWAIESISAK